MKIVVVDYQLGNLFSVLSALRFLGHDPVIDKNGQEIDRARIVILPGVAAFGEGIENLQASGQFEALRRRANHGIPLVGLCLGAQLLLEESDESPGKHGLSLIKGRVEGLRSVQKRVPNQGWSQLRSTPFCPSQLTKSAFAGSWLYFSHSFRLVPRSTETVWMETAGDSQPIAAVIGQGNIFGLQFHPERSGHEGVGFLGSVIETANSR